jgi:hypothetical protein
MTDGGRIVARKLTTAALMLMLAAPAWAQQPQQQDDEAVRNRRLKDQMQVFEAVLTTAVRHGAEELARRVADRIPANLSLTVGDAQVKGLLVPSGGLLFLVLVPEVQASAQWLIQQSRPTRSVPVPPGAVPSSPTADTRDPRVNAMGPVAADPMAPSPAAVSNPDREYAMAVRDALIDAMLDNSGALPIREDEWLTVAAIDGVGSAGVVNSPFDSTLYLSIKGSDLAQFRQGKISREDVRKLVTMRQF